MATRDIKKYQFKEGQSGNPKGRPPILPQINEAIANVLNEKEGAVTTLEAILRALIKKAIKGDIKAAQLILDRAYGKPQQSFDVTNDPLTEIRIVGITFDDKD